MPKDCSFVFFGQTWTLTRRPAKGKNLKLGGECSLKDSMIIINDTYMGDEFLSYLHHELFEGACICAGACYEKQFPGTDSLIAMNHDQLDVISGQVRAAYDEIRGKMCL